MGLYNWVGETMKSPEGRIGIVIKDDNLGIFRILTVKFEDTITEQLWLANTGENPRESWDWQWLNKYDDKEMWIRCGK